MKHLLAVNLGPVQDFIVQARRTRDLWYGSYLLSQMSRRAAETLVRDGGVPVFPSMDAGTLPESVANKILVEVHGDADAAAVTARDARDAAMNCLRDLAEQARKKAGELLDDKRPGFEAVWNEQIETFVEFNAAWVAFGDGIRTYSEARDVLEKALAGRKNLRDFEPWPAQTRGVKRSTLDGVRETLLRRDREHAGRVVKEYRVTPGEELDAIGIIRRMGESPGQFVPITTLALAAWITKADATAPEAMKHLRSECQGAGIAGIKRKDLGWCAAFPFEAQVLLRDRWKSVAEDEELAEDTRKTLEGSARAVLDRMQAPHPYVACLVADGDHMGKTLDGLDRIEDHQKFSGYLADFATEARRVVEQEHRGLLVYSGGDDVLAFVTLTDALDCANKLRELFDSKMKDAVKGTQAPCPTLSVGLGVGHLLEDMSTLLELGREAEKIAKGGNLPTVEQRNAVAVVVDKRAGSKVSWRCRWDSTEGNPMARMEKDAKLLREDLSTKKVYEIKRTLGGMPAPGSVPPAERAEWARVLQAEVRRSLARVNAGSNLEPKDVGLALEGEDYDSAYAAVDRWVNRMLVARMFAAAVPEARRDRGE